MKFRNGFVSNSSSSSFLICGWKFTFINWEGVKALLDKKDIKFLNKLGFDLDENSEDLSGELNEMCEDGGGGELSGDENLKAVLSEDYLIVGYGFSEECCSCLEISDNDIEKFVLNAKNSLIKKYNLPQEEHPKFLTGGFPG